MKKAKVFNIQRFSLHDGPGIRTVVFFKGCSLRCRWCANPEGISPDMELKHSPRLCRHCGMCAKNCPANAIEILHDGIIINRSVCNQCGICVKNCPASALEWCGEKDYSVDELFDIVRRESAFYHSSKGGVTLSGGEALLQNEFVVAFLKKCKEAQINTAIETAGNYPFDYLNNVAPYCDTIFFDVKGWDKEKTLYCIGTNNERIIQNLTALDALIRDSEHKPKLIVRTPLLPELNYSLKDYEKFIEFIKQFTSLTKVDILPFHNLGEYKYTQLGKEYDFQGRDNLSEESVEEYKKLAEKHNVPCSVTTI